MNIEKGDIILASLDPVRGSEQGKTRPCLIVQNNIANKYSPTTIIVPITSAFSDKQYPTEVIIDTKETGLKERSVVLCNQIRTLDIKERLIQKIGKLDSKKLYEVNEALKTSLAIE